MFWITIISGDIVHLKIFGQHTILLGTYQAARDLLDKRSVIYSDRPPLIMAKLTAFTEWATTLVEYGPRWRTHRRALHQELGAEFVSKYRTVQLQIAHELLRKLLQDPTHFLKHIEMALAATSLRVAYGLELSNGNEKYLRMLRTLNEIGVEFMVPGKFLVEAIPALQHLPTWFPGADFKRQAIGVVPRVRQLVRGVFEAGKSNMESGVVHESILTRILQSSGQQDQDSIAETEDLCASVAATVYTAGAETTEASIQAFFLAMALHPDVQKKAQAELDEVIGSGRLPDFSDRQSLPYVNALIMELVRWHIVTPTGLPHTTIQDDEYNGYFIPKGSVIVPNVWAYSRDPSCFPEPELFSPERFLRDGEIDKDVTSPYDFIFGFGRRICPGRHLADAALFIICSSILHVFEISPPVAADGTLKPLEAKFSDDLITSHPEPFECEVRARSAETAALVISTHLMEDG
ncbi:CyP450 monooxygenase [Fomes fomentarius]|nr:CyP450 monooxygenase [Fomes fomentarius]